MITGVVRRAQRRCQEELAEHVDHRHLCPVRRVGDREAAAGRVLREVGRPDHAVRFGKVRDHLLAPPRVVAERDDVAARGEDLLRQLRRDPEPVGGVLAVDDAEVRGELLAQAGKQSFDGAHAGRAVHIGDEEEPYGSARVAAGWTSSETWLPASCV
jgi:hypothetical protein